MKRVVQNAMRSGAQGIKVQIGGRLGGAEEEVNGTVKEEFLCILYVPI